eukprot:401550-Rhodomonas_salina.1
MVATYDFFERSASAVSRSASSGWEEMPPPVRYYRKRGRDCSGVERTSTSESTMSVEEKSELRAMRNRLVGAQIGR